ncbi:MAG: hypothetical protein ABIQ02_08445 [Saprospiraceae bacterium]
MGLSIYYRGMLRNLEEIDLLIEDVTDICLEIGWRCHPIHQSNIMPAKGLWITPERSESIDLTFLPNGRLYNCAHFIFIRHPETEVVDEKKYEWIFTKTNYAGSDTHMAIIKFFRYLQRKYFKEFEMHDDSQYWETNDEAKCLFHFGESEDAREQMGKAMNLMGNDFDPEAPFEDDDDLISMAFEMEEMLFRRQGFDIKLN